MMLLRLLTPWFIDWSLFIRWQPWVFTTVCRGLLHGDGIECRLAMQKLTQAMSMNMIAFGEVDRGGPGGAAAFVDRLTLWWKLFGTDTCMHMLTQAQTHIKSRVFSTHVCLWFDTWLTVKLNSHILSDLECWWPKMKRDLWPDLRNTWLETSDEIRAPATLVPYNGRVWLCQTTHEENRPVFQAQGNLAWICSSVSQSVESDDVCLWKKCCLTCRSCCTYMLQMDVNCSFFFDLRHSGAVCLRRTLPFGRRQVWQPMRLTQSSDLKGALQGLLNQDDKRSMYRWNFESPCITGWVWLADMRLPWHSDKQWQSLFLNLECQSVRESFGWPGFWNWKAGSTIGRKNVRRFTPGIAAKHCSQPLSDEKVV